MPPRRQTTEPGEAKRTGEPSRRRAGEDLGEVSGLHGVGPGSCSQRSNCGRELIAGAFVVAVGREMILASDFPVSPRPPMSYKVQPRLFLLCRMDSAE